MNLDLSGKHALVTGGSRGIGRAIVLTLAEQGASVAAVYQRESDAVTSLAAELDQHKGDNFVVQADVSNDEAVSKLTSDVRDRYGKVDVLVNNAGVVSHRTIDDLDLDEWRRVIDTNLTALYLVTKGVVDIIPEGGSVIIVGSAVATRGMPGRTHYASSKAGAIGFMRALCKEIGPRGIRVNLIAPGIIETDQAADLTEESRTRYSRLAALNRLGSADEIAGAVLFLASDLSAFVSGVTLNVDGGI
jgi:NAD(P)-dependent dehydrogenase (short-subunit alcohol dehydrogenase family)